MFEVHGPERKLRRLEGHMIMDRPGRPGPRSRGREIPAAPAEGGKIGNPGIFGKWPEGLSSSTMRTCGLHKAAVKAVAGVEGGFSEMVLFWWGASVFLISQIS